MNCDVLPEGALSDLLDGALGPLTKWHVRRHLTRCPICRREMRTLRRFGDAARAWHGDAVLPIAFRGGIAARLPVEPPRRRLRVGTAVVVVALLCLAFLTFGLPLVRPLPSFAQVRAATRRFETVQWRETFALYEKGQRVGSTTIAHEVRRDPPAWANHLVAAENRQALGEEDFRAVATPAGLFVYNREHHVVRITPNPQTPDEFLDGLRQLVFSEFPGQKPERSWDRWNGRRLLRYQVDWAPEPGLHLRSVWWADPETRRLVRRETRAVNERRKRTEVTVADGYQYNRPIAQSAFDTTPPPGAAVRHFDLP